MSTQTGVYQKEGGWSWLCPACKGESETPVIRDTARAEYKTHRAGCALRERATPTPTSTPTKDSTVATTKKKRATKKATAKRAAGKKKPAKKTKSTANRKKGSVALVWEIADRMKDAARKDVIAACVKRGINVHTARTQYQRWFSEGA